jgi:hypothetical protein
VKRYSPSSVRSAPRAIEAVAITEVETGVWPEVAAGDTTASGSAVWLTRLRDRRFLEPVLPNPKVKLRARQPKSPGSLRFISTALVQDLRNRRAFDDAQIRGVVARPPGA